MTSLTRRRMSRRRGRAGGELAPADRRTPHTAPPTGSVSVWDIMGYHGIIWASMNSASPNQGSVRAVFNYSLTLRRLKERLRYQGVGGNSWGARRTPARSVGGTWAPAKS